MQEVIQAIRDGIFGERNTLLEIIATISNNNDWYLISADFVSYLECQERVRYMLCIGWSVI